MIKVNVKTNSIREPKIVSENTTVREVLESLDIDYDSVMFNIDGYGLRPGDMDKTFADFGITDHCYLSGVVKQDNA